MGWNRSAAEVVITAGVLSLFCLFSFGTAKLRARIHQERRQALVSMDNLDHQAASIAAPMPVALVAAVLAMAAPRRLEGPAPVRLQAGLLGLTVPPLPLRGPPAA